MDLPSNDQLLASAIRFLIDGGDEEAASILLTCALEAEQTSDTWYDGPRTTYGVDVILTGPRKAYEVLNDNTPLTTAIRDALRAVLPSDCYIDRIIPRAELVVVDPNWREEMRDAVRGKGITNQAADDVPTKARIWANLRFRSESEVRIAQALDQARVLFLPNCKARLNTPRGRANREPDFLLCRDGKWGILEVDGEPFHPPSRTVHDHDRDRLFRAHGVRVVEHFDANECYQDPEGVVQRFLAILAGS